MSEAGIPHTRKRVNISQTAKGLHQIDVTVEDVNEVAIDATKLAGMALEVLKAIEKALTEDKRKLVTEVE